jgi:hypothetical protein
MVQEQRLKQRQRPSKGSKFPREKKWIKLFIDPNSVMCSSFDYKHSTGLWTMRLSMKTPQQSQPGELKEVARKWLLACDEQLCIEDKKEFPQKQERSEFAIENYYSRVNTNHEGEISEVIFQYRLLGKLIDGAEATIRLDKSRHFLGATITRPSYSGRFATKEFNKINEKEVVNIVLERAREVADYEKDDPILQQWKSNLIAAWYFHNKEWEFGYTIPCIFKKAKAKDFRFKFGCPNSHFVDYVVTISGEIIDEIPRVNNGPVFIHA